MGHNVNTKNVGTDSIPVTGTTHHAITVSSSANDLATLGSFSWADTTKHVWIGVAGANIRATFDGTTTPSASTGFQITDGQHAFWSIHMARAANVVREGSTDADVNVQELQQL